jgi:uncharacterized protein
MEYFLCVLGLVMVIEGLPYFGFPDKIKAFMQVVLEQDDTTLRIMGGALMLAGLLILAVARRALNAP